MLKTLNNENGIALVLALLVLVALTLMGIAAINTSTLDIKVAANERAAMQAQYAAEAGIGETVGRMNLDSADTNYISTPPTSAGLPWPADWSRNPDPAYRNWSKAFKKDIRTTDGKVFFSYTTTVSLLPLTTKGVNGVAFYNHSSGYTKSPFSTGGMPVYKITSIGSSGNYRSEVTLDITKDAYLFQIKGGLTANGVIDVRGSPFVDGRQYTSDGLSTGGSCSNPSLQGDKYAVFSNGTTLTNNAGNQMQLFGSPTKTMKDPGFSITSPWQALGISENAFNELFSNKQPISYTGSRAGEIWIGGTGTVTSQAQGNVYNGTSQSIAGTGILVVHNPKFVATGVNRCQAGDPGYPDFSSNNPADRCYKEKAPAVLKVSKDKFQGLVIADQVDLSGGVQIIGSVISLTTLTTSATGTGNPTIKYSCEAIERFAGGRVKRKLAWNVIR